VGGGRGQGGNQGGREGGSGADDNRIRLTNFGVHEDASRWNKKEMAEATRTDPELAMFAAWFSERRFPLDCNQLAEFDSVSKSLHAQWERFSLREGMLYRQHWDNSGNKDMWQIVVPVRYRQEAMYSAHQSVSGGHMGVKKTQLKLAM